MICVYHPELRSHLKQNSDAVFYLSQLYVLAKKFFSGGRFYQSKKQIERATMLKRFRQDKARAICIEEGFLEYETGYEGTNRRSFFKVNTDRIDQILGKVEKERNKLKKRANPVTEKEVGKKEKSLKINAKKITMEVGWEPDTKLTALACEANQIPTEFIKIALPDFIAYHFGNSATDFQSRFISHLKRQWVYSLNRQRRSLKTNAALDKLNEAKVERINQNADKLSGAAAKAKQQRFTSALKLGKLFSGLEKLDDALARNEIDKKLYDEYEQPLRSGLDQQYPDA